MCFLVLLQTGRILLFEVRKYEKTIDVKVEMNFFIAEIERAAKIMKNAVYHFLMSLLVPEL